LCFALRALCVRDSGGRGARTRLERLNDRCESALAQGRTDLLLEPQALKGPSALPDDDPRQAAFVESSKRCAAGDLSGAVEAMKAAI